jgi:hypothetical protein
MSKEIDRKELILIYKQLLKCLIIYMTSIIWTVGVFIYSTLANVPDILPLTAGLLFLLIVSSLSSQNKSFEKWILYFFVIFFLGGTTIVILNKTMCISRLICIFAELFGLPHNLCPCEI